MISGGANPKTNRQFSLFTLWDSITIGFRCYVAETSSYFCSSRSTIEDLTITLHRIRETLDNMYILESDRFIYIEGFWKDVLGGFYRYGLYRKNHQVTKSPSLSYQLGLWMSLLITSPQDTWDQRWYYTRICPQFYPGFVCFTLYQPIDSTMFLSTPNLTAKIRPAT